MACLPILNLKHVSLGKLPITCLEMLSDALLAKTLKIRELTLPFPPAHRFRNGNFYFPRITSEDVTKLRFVVIGILDRIHAQEIAENYPALDSLVIEGAVGAKLDICGLLIELPFLSSLEFCQMGISFADGQKAPLQMRYLDSLPSHTNLKHLSFTNCQVDSKVGTKLLEKMPNLSITYKDCSSINEEASL
jgi:hypothetical protein